MKHEHLIKALHALEYEGFIIEGILQDQTDIQWLEIRPSVDGEPGEVIGVGQPPQTFNWDVVTAKAAELALQEPLDQCKTEAKKRIAATDWSVLPDVGISNTAEFETYRAALRELIKNPVADPVWPTEPEPVWS